MTPQAPKEIVVVDDDALSLAALKVALEGDFTVHCFSEPRGAESFLATRRVEFALLDLNFPSASGIEIMKRWKQQFPDLEIVMCSGEPRVERAIECLRRGASEYVVKPFDPDDIRLILRRTLEKAELKRKWEKLKPLVLPHPVDFIGESAAMGEVREKISLLKGHQHLNVLILGESGTGKEVIARKLHEQESDSQRPFVIVNMPAIPATLMESELFGVEKGAFTDAKQSRAGKFEQADGGDIFLDEIGDLPLETQAKILRALQEKQIERVGSSRTQKVHFRTISATNRPLADLMSGGEFREDLIYRLSDLVLWVPPLREHPEDIPALVAHFLRRYSRRPGAVPRVSDEALAQLMAHSWPGNIRQLESTIKRALVFNRGPVLENVEVYDLSTFNPTGAGVSSAASLPLDAQLESCERKIFLDSLRRHRNNRDAVMSELKLPRATFYRRLMKLGIALD